MSLTQSQPVSAPHRGAGSPASGQGTWALGWPEVRGTLSGTKHFIGLVHTHVGVHNSLGYFYEMAKEVNYDPIHFFPNFSKTVTIFHRSTSIKLFPVSNNAGLDKALMGFPANFPSLGPASSSCRSDVRDSVFIVVLPHHAPEGHCRSAFPSPTQLAIWVVASKMDIKFKS